MKITAHHLNNYHASAVKNPVQQKTLNSIPGKDITAQEKEFFTRLFPSQKNEILDYHFYSSKGKLNGVAVGTNIDMKG